LNSYGGRNEQINLLPARKYTLRKKKTSPQEDLVTDLGLAHSSVLSQFSPAPRGMQKGGPSPSPHYYGSSTRVSVVFTLKIGFKWLFEV